MPIKELKYFKKITVKKGSSINHRIVIPVNELQKWDLNKNEWMLYPGSYKLVIGAHAKDEKITTLFEVQ
jgi:beta-glucosidase